MSKQWLSQNPGETEAWRWEWGSVGKSERQLGQFVEFRVQPFARLGKRRGTGKEIQARPVVMRILRPHD